MSDNMNSFTNFTSRTIVLAEDNIDTDQIIPARFLTTTTRAGLGDCAFYDWRYDKDGHKRSESVLNNTDIKTHTILVGGHNFGCGSSREHAPWALLDFGFRAVISSGIADIFRNNAARNGLLPIVVDPEIHRWLLGNPGAEVAVDLEACAIRLPDGQSHSFPIDAFSRRCLLDGVDQLGFLLQSLPDIEKFEEAHR